MSPGGPLFLTPLARRRIGHAGLGRTCCWFGRPCYAFSLSSWFLVVYDSSIRHSHHPGYGSGRTIPHCCLPALKRPRYRRGAPTVVDEVISPFASDAGYRPSALAESSAGSRVSIVTSHRVNEDATVDTRPEQSTQLDSGHTVLPHVSGTACLGSAPPHTASQLHSYNLPPASTGYTGRSRSLPRKHATHNATLT